MIRRTGLYVDFLVFTLHHCLSPIHSEHQRCNGEQKEHYWHAPAQRVIARSEVGDDCTNKEQRESGSSSNPNQGTPIPISKPAAPAAFSMPRIGSDDSGTPNLFIVLRSHSGRLK